MASKKRDSEYWKENKAKNRQIDKILGERFRDGEQNKNESYSDFKKRMKNSVVKQIPF